MIKDIISEFSSCAAQLQFVCDCGPVPRVLLRREIDGGVRSATSAFIMIITDVYQPEDIGGSNAMLWSLHAAIEEVKRPQATNHQFKTTYGRN